MTPALIGLLGVIAGGLLGGAVTYRVERRKRRDDATVAGRLIVLELRAAAVRLRKSGEAGKPWPGKLPDKQWQEHASELIGFLPRERRERTKQKTPLAAQLLPASPQGPDAGSTGTAASAQTRAGQPGREAARGLRGDRRLERGRSAGAGRRARRREAGAQRRRHTRLEGVGNELKAWLNRPRPQRDLARLTALALVILALLAAGAALIVQRPHATAQTVAAAIAAGLSGRQTVECLDQPGDAWDCTAQTVDDARSVCGASLRLPPKQASVRQLTAAPARCRPRGQPQRYEAVLRGGDVVAVPVASSAQPELEERREILDSPVDQERWYQVIIDAILDR